MLCEGPAVKNYTRHLFYLIFFIFFFILNEITAMQCFNNYRMLSGVYKLNTYNINTQITIKPLSIYLVGGRGDIPSTSHDC